MLSGSSRPIEEESGCVEPTPTCVGVSARRGWKVRIQRQRVQDNMSGMIYSGNTFRNSGYTPVEADGKFEFEGLARANYNLHLVIPHKGGSIEVPIEPIRMRRRDLTREFDMSEDMPGRLVGKVRVTGAPLLPERLLVLARRFDGSNSHYFSGFCGRVNLVGAKAFVRGSKFELPLREGRYVIQLIDRATGVALFQHPNLVKIVPNKEETFDITADLAMVRVTLTPETEGAKVVASRLEIRPEHPDLAENAMRNVFTGNNNQDSGVGVMLRPGQTEVEVIVPSVDVKFFVRSVAHQLDPKQSSYNFGPVGEGELTPDSGKSNKLTIEVAEPQVDVTSQRR